MNESLLIQWQYGGPHSADFERTSEKGIDADNEKTPQSRARKDQSPLSRAEVHSRYALQDSELR